MKKLLIIYILIIAVPFLVVTFLVSEDKIIEKKYEFVNNNNTIVRVMRDETKKIEEIALEDYIVGVVAAEMPASFELEALKAQAVASRNYTYKKLETNKDKEYDVIDTTANQVYKSIEQLKDEWKLSYVKNINKIRQAVSETMGEYATYNGEVIGLFYFSTSNGYTEDAVNVFNEDVPYLKSVSSPWDLKENPNYEKEIKFKKIDFCKKIEVQCNNITISNIKRDKSNRITQITINGHEYNGRDLYNKLKLRSTDFEISIDNDDVIFKTKGYGHGVGMSQYGANGMAKEGKNYKEILTHYYQGTTVKKI